MNRDWLRNLLFGFGGAVGGALCGFLLALVVVFVCSTTVGGPNDLGVAILLALGTILVGVIAGAVVGARLGTRDEPPKS
jgi:ABC-type antimicrobial peptide transport system permease subunit